jgi:uroporphyrinogen-III synthase
VAFVLVARPAGQEAGLVRRLRGRGHQVAHRPLITIVPTGDSPVDLEGYDWLVVTSVNGAVELGRRGVGRPRRVAAIGAATARALGGADLVPAVATQEGLLTELPADPGRVLVAGAAGARPLLAETLGADVVVLYRTELLDAVLPPGLDLAALTSGSQARSLARVSGPPPVVTIGPTTTAAACLAGLTVLAEAERPGLTGLVAAVDSVSA